MSTFLEVILTLVTIASVFAAFLLWRRQDTIENLESKLHKIEDELQLTKQELLTQTEWVSQNDIRGLRKKFAKIEEWAKTVTTAQPRFHNAIILGPRAAGKSSVVSLWCKIERVISSISPTPNFETFEYKLSGTVRETFVDNQIGIKRTRLLENWLKIYDYAGEDSRVTAAVDRLTAHKGSSVIFVMNADPKRADGNRKYFSRVFAEKLNEAFSKNGSKASNVENVFLIFNKIDLHPEYKKLPIHEITASLQKEFSNSISVLESVFSPNIKVKSVSAMTNENVLNLLQDLVIGAESYLERENA